MMLSGRIHNLNADLLARFRFLEHFHFHQYLTILGTVYFSVVDSVVHQAIKRDVVNYDSHVWDTVMDCGTHPVPAPNTRRDVLFDIKMSGLGNICAWRR